MEYISFAPMDDKHLGQFGENTARAMCIEGHMWGRPTWKETLSNLAQIRLVRDRLAGKREPEGGATEWLLDNWYLAQREGRSGAEAFRRVRRLRYVVHGHRQPMVIALARAFVRAAGGEVGPRRLGVFLTHAQAGLPLTEEELRLLVPALKCALVERLAALCGEVEHPEADREGELSDGMEAVFTALRTLSTSDLTELLEQSSRVEDALREDPAGVYPEMDDETRSRYRAQLCRLAKKHRTGELEMAELVLAQAQKGTGRDRHVGAWLFPEGRGALALTLYIGGIALLTCFLALLAGFALQSIWVALLLALPISDIVKNCADFLSVRLVRPRPVFRMALHEGIPAQGRTLCVIACLLTNEKSGGELSALLEQYRLANRDAGSELRLGLLADLPDRARPAGEQERAWVEAAKAAVEGLNKKYGGGFYLFFRESAFHAPDQRYMGWERKRGALVELVRLLRGRRTGLEVAAGEKGWLRKVAYVITLDTDTSLSVGAASELTGAMLHPLNRPVIDGKRRVVTAGYGLLQPRVAVDLESANKSHFSRIFAGQGGMDPYGSASSDVYHDLFGEGTFTGKGIFDVNAFFTCLDGRFPKNAVLSHDLLEGSYLRAGLIGDVELTDGYPYKVTSYFSRLHRWVRGDWQLLPWLGLRVRNEAGEREENPLGDLPRWKIFDNLRRSLSPVGTLTTLLVGMCISQPIFALAAGVAVLSAASNLLLTGADLAFRRGQGFAERYHSTIIAGFGGVLLQTLVQLLFLPYHAWVCASAACTALWRMGATHRGLLAWTTAAEADRRAEKGLWPYYCKLWPLAATGLFCVLCSQFPLGGAAGLVWMAGPFFAWTMSRPIRQSRGVSNGDRPFLLHQGALIWKYFADFLTPQDHYLPPDNYQEQPGVGLARRTSPTNIGMSLLSCMAAADLELVPRNRALSLIERTLTSVEALEKWKGHLYNWYDTGTTCPLEPRYVSSVDSGNLCGCLIALREGLLEWGEEKLARRAGALADAMDFSILYDKSRRLFYIGYDCSKEAYTQGWYDLLASEARQTSYLAVARGEVPRRHWRRLSRALVGQDHYSGMASWTGTMFEYFMPHLLLPAEQNSLLYESLAFCLYAQKKRVKGTGAPWGISESSFFAFDGAMNYQYKAHGVQRLGLKRGLDREMVISPYSSFLALHVAPRSGTRNLRALAGLGLEGPYGLYEAADFTPGRVSGQQSFETVRSYMVHHLGMSLVALDNALHDGIMQKRFMRDAAMSAYQELLREKVPVGAHIMRAPRDEVPEKPGRGEAEPFLRTGAGWNIGCPECHLIAGGAWRVLCTDAGAAWSRMGRTTLTRCVWNRQYESAGLSFFLRTPEGLLPLTPAPLYREGPEYTWRFQGNGACWSAAWQGYTASAELWVPERENGEIREITVNWNGPGEREVELICYLEPVLARLEDYQAHPAFSKLSLESQSTGDGVLFTRRNRRQGENRPALAVLWDQREAGFDTSREEALGRGGLRALEHALARGSGESEGAVLDPCLLARFPLTLGAGEQVKVRLALSAADSGDQAVEGALRLLHGGQPDLWGTMDRIKNQIVVTSEETLQAFELLRRLQFPSKSWVRRGSAEQRALWPFGISGDLPIAAFEVVEEEGLKPALMLERIHQLLVRCGFPFDLVFLLDEGGDYLHPLRDALTDALRTDGWDHHLGVREGIFMLEAEGAQALREAALLLDPQGRPKGEDQLAPYIEKGNPFTIHSGVPPFRFLEDGRFQFDAGMQLPPLGWSIPLCNPQFGWRTDETGSGHLWLINAKENPLTEWRNDPLGVSGPEQLLFGALGRETSFFAGPDGIACTVRYGFGEALWEKELGNRSLRCTAFVPRDENARYLLLESSGGGGEVVYRLEGEPERWWPMAERLCLRTAPTADGHRAETAPTDYGQAAARLEETRAWWRGQVSALTVHTPDEGLDRYLNGWALYQVEACRLFARTSLYQNGGAYGFRDQLQDVCALLLTAPELVREQLLRACAHQYEEGDVMHWWHPQLPHGQEMEKGVRTRITDDLLWLPYVLCEYLEKTGDRTVLEEQVPFLSSAPLEAGERERYEENRPSERSASALEHACLAVELVLKRGPGPHGLVKMGTGDWNDGMDLVGAEGRGESVWLTWFLTLVLERFAPLCPETDQTRYEGEARRYAEAANGAWDGAWFLRGWYDDGHTLGSAHDEECQIDSIAQSFAALSSLGDRERAGQGVDSALERLFDREHQMVKLFAPPFDQGDRDPGYIRGYLPGVRENGGQYTHAAVWLALALLRLERPEEGWEILHALLPTSHDPAEYRAEPYVLAADVYANPQHLGRGGWSWYTGAASWYYRAAVEELLGLQVREGLLYLAPKLPKDWDGYEAQWALEEGKLHLVVKRTGTQRLLLDGKPHDGGIPLKKLKGEHQVLFSY